LNDVQQIIVKKSNWTAVRDQLPDIEDTLQHNHTLQTPKATYI
jgi:hypothetical protein